jgi:hypothetical protein
VRPVESRGRLIDTETYLVGEDLLMYYEQEFVIDVLRKELIEFLFPLRVLSLLYLAVMILN